MIDRIVPAQYTKQHFNSVFNDRGKELLFSDEETKKYFIKK
jgi:hypothetical protein